MLSSRGATTKDQVMLECTSTQEGREVFLLSELERVWEALCAVLRERLLEGYNVRVPHFGSFWFETIPVVCDGPDRYFARRLRFGIDGHFALRYNLDTSRVPLEPPRLEYARVPMSDVVTASGVPARTAALALREFFSYIGEGLFRQRVFRLDFDAVACLVAKRERAQLDADADFRRDLFAIDARKWPPAVRVAAESVVLCADSRPPSAASRRSAGSRFSAPRPLELRPAFVPAAPAGRLFADIARDTPRALPAGGESGGRGWEVGAGGESRDRGWEMGAVRESVFDALDPDEYPLPEPEIEHVEELTLQRPTLRAFEEVPPHPVPPRTSIHAHSTVRDLLYGPVMAPRLDPITGSRRRYFNRETDQVAALLKGS